MTGGEIAALVMAGAALLTAGVTAYRNRSDVKASNANADQTNVETAIMLVKELRDKVGEQSDRISRLSARVENLELEIRRANLYIEKLIHQLGLAQIIPEKRVE